MVSVRASVKFLFAVFIILSTLIGCDDIKDRPNSFVVDGDYDVNTVDLSCSNPDRCTNSLGVILTISSRTESRYGYQITSTSVNRCTGALYSATQVLTAGHCTSSIGQGRSYFRTVAAPGNPSRTFEISRVQKSFYSPSEVYSTDFAALELKTPALGYNYVRPPSEIASDLTHVTALVVNQPGEDTKILRLDSVDCEVDVDSLPLHLSKFPNLWGTKLCKIVSGNSGAPVFARNNLNEVLGVISKSTEAGQIDATSRLFELLFNRKQNAPRPNLATAAHAACFDLPGWRPPAPQCRSLNANTIKTLSKEGLEISINQGIKAAMRDFLKSPRAQIQINGARLKASPLPVTLSVEDFNSKRAGVALIPQPNCIESGEPGERTTQSFSAEVLEVKPRRSSATLERNGDSLSVTLRLNKLSSGRYSLGYTFNTSRYRFSPLSNEISKLNDMGEIDLAPCTGTEEKSLLEDLDKTL